MATAAETLFAGGGEIGARMRAYDWAASPLGPVEAWPESLKTCVRIILTSRQPMFVWWGDELINLYNDAYQAIVGGKHPGALGMPAREVWREIWDQVGPRAESAMRRNEGTYDEALLLIMERHGYPEETYYTFSYSPVPNDEGGTGGILCANADDTQRIIGERQLSLLRELASRTSEARTVAEACVRSAESLAGNLRDLPFALLYLADPERKTLTPRRQRGDRPRRRRSRPSGCSSARPRSGRSRRCSATGEPRQVPAPSALPEGRLGPAREGGGGAPARRLRRGGAVGRARRRPQPVPPARRRLPRLPRARRRADRRGDRQRAAPTRRSGGAPRRSPSSTARRPRSSRNVSHEFRTPLTLMLGPTRGRARAPEPRAAPASDAATTVHRNALRLLKLVNTLLDFSRIEAGRVAGRRTSRPTSPRSPRSSRAPSARRSSAPGSRFVVDCPPLPRAGLRRPRHVGEDRPQPALERVQVHLRGRDRGRARARTAGASSSTVARHRRRASPQASCRALFERFHRVEGARGAHPRGHRHRPRAGAASSSSCTAARSRVESALGRGHDASRSRIPLGSGAPAAGAGRRRPRRSRAPARGAEPFVEEALRWLPAPSDAASPRRAALAPLPPATGPRAARRARRRRQRRHARLRRAAARARAGTVEAVARRRRGARAPRARSRPDLVLTDVMMPGLDGFGLLARAARPSGRPRAIPVIMLSARAGEEARVEGLEAGADDYLVKPFSARELLARVSAHLELARLRRVAELERAKLGMLFAQAPVGIAVFAGPEHVARAREPALPRAGRPAAPGSSASRSARRCPSCAARGFYELLDRVFQTGEPFVGKGYEVHLARGARRVGGAPVLRLHLPAATGGWTARSRGSWSWSTR